MLPVQSFIGAGHIRDTMWNAKSKKDVVKAQQQIFGLLDLFEDCANTRIEEGCPMGLEASILNESIRMAQEFLHEARSRKRALQNRVGETMALPTLSFRLLGKMQSHAFPEVLMNQVMSFLPPVYRWDSLRLKYTDEFLTEGLKKKSIPRIGVIFNSLYKQAESHVAFMKQHEDKVVGQFVKNNANGNPFGILEVLLTSAKSDWYISNKAEKIDAIVSLYKKLEDNTAKWIVKKDIYDESCSKMTKILHALVIAIQPKKTEKKVRKPRKTRAKVTAPLPVPAITSPPESIFDFIIEAYRMIGIELKDDNYEPIINFVRKVECDVLAAEVETCTTEMEKAEAIWRFAKRNSRD